MKRYLFICIVAMATVSVLVSCTSKPEKTESSTPQKASASVVIEKDKSITEIDTESSIRFAVGEEYKIEYTVLPEDADNPDIIFSSDCDVIEVSSDGTVTAADVAEGTVTLSSDDGSVTAEIEVETYEVPVESISIKEDMIIGIDETVEVPVTVLPENASFNVPVLSSSDENVFVCDGGCITGVNKGEAVLTASSRDGSITSEVMVTVTRGPYAPLHEITANRYQKTDGIYIREGSENSGRATLMFTGDMMCLSGQQSRASGNGTYDFDSSFSMLSGILGKSDFAIGNLETLLSHSFPYSSERKAANGNPVCNAPSTFLDCVKLGGFDAVVTANNHASDAGRQGVIETLRRLDLYDIIHTGTFTDESDSRFILADINGIKTAFLAYTTIQNNFWGYYSNEERDYMMNKYSSERLEKDIADAKDAGAEFIVAYNHWGTEYTRSVTGDQKSMAQEMADAGVDLVIGSHTHCLQHATILKASDGRNVPCVYSMGNFVSSVSNDISYDTIILSVDIARENGSISVTDWGYIGCRCCSSYNGGSYVVVPVSPELNGGDESFQNAAERIASVMGEEISEITSLE